MDFVDKELISQIFNVSDNIVICDAKKLEAIYKGKYVEDFKPTSVTNVVQHVGEATHNGKKVQVFLANSLNDERCILLNNADK